MGSLVVVLIVLQLLSFYFIVLLFTRLSRFKDLERKQEQLMREMNDIVSAYLLEMREENDRLIEELSKPKQQFVESADLHNQNKVPINNPVAPVLMKETLQQVTKESKEAVMELDIKALVPKAVATKAYSQQKIPANEVKSTNQFVKPVDQQKAPNETELSFEEKVVKLYKEGKSTEEIAKIMQKGKTEIELLLKFHT